MGPRRILVFTLLLLAGAGTIVSARPVEAQPVFLTHAEIETQIAPAVPYVETPWSSGSGVLIGPRHVLTNAHVLHPFDQASLLFTDGSTYIDVPVVAWDLTADMVVLELPSDATVPPITVISADGLPIGTTVYAIGYPGQPDGSAPLAVMDGRINRLRSWPGLGVDYVQSSIPVIGGMSGGALVTSAGELIAFNEWSLDSGDSVGPAAVDVIDRLDAELAGGDVDRLGIRYPEVTGPAVRDLEFDLLDSRDERAFVTAADVAGALSVTVSAAGSAWIGAVLPDGTILEASSAEAADDHVIEFVNPGLGVPITIIVDQISELPAHYAITSNVDLFPVDDPDDRKVITESQLLWGQVDYTFERDTFIVPLEAGQRLDILVESLLVDQFVAIERLANGEREFIDWDDDSGGGIWGVDPLLSFVAPETADYHLIVGGLVPFEVGGYVANIQILDSDGAISGTFTSPLTDSGLALSTWGGGGVDEMVAAAAIVDCDLQSFWVTVDGELIGYLVGAPDFVNGRINQLYPSGLPPRTPLLVDCGS